MDKGTELAIADSIMVKKHAVTVEVTLVPGQGTELVITIPVQLIQRCQSTRCHLK